MKALSKDRNHQGRPISVDFHSTPQVYSAIFSQEYDGATDSRHAMGFGRTEEEAIANLIEHDEAMSTRATKGEE